MKKWIVRACLVGMVVFPMVKIYAIGAGQIIQRVYIDDQMVGVLSDTSIYEKYREEKIEKYLNEYNEEDIIIPDNIRIEEEITYIPYEKRDDEIIKYIDDTLKFKTKGYYVKIGNSSMCVKEVAHVEKEIESLIKVYVTEKELEVVKDQSKPIEPLVNEGSQVIGIKFEPKIEYVNTICNIDDIAKNEEIGNLILTGYKEPTKVKSLSQSESIEDLSARNSMKYSDFKLLNYRVLGNQRIPYVGQAFNVSEMNQDIQIKVEKETVKEEIIAYTTETIEDPTLPVGEIFEKQEGYDGVKLTSYKQVYVNGELRQEERISERVVNEAQNRIVVKGSKVIPSRGTKDWQWPTTRYSISCAYLCYSGHYALDISASVGQPIFAADNGIVVKAGWDGAYGYSVFINHNNGYYTRYAHMSSVSVKSGQVVAGGQSIGKAGNTGNSTGPHLHFEIRTNTGSQPSYAPNPMSFY
ncbi:MAG: peptidoglycan DD-metalloendopeptidase family protein [Turicibacter sp.]